MKRSLTFGALALAAATFGAVVPESRADDPKNISDGAAKGQANEGTAQPTGTGDTGDSGKVNNTTTRSNTQHN